MSEAEKKTIQEENASVPETEPAEKRKGKKKKEKPKRPLWMEILSWVLTLLAAVEDEFDVEFSMGQTVKMKNVGEMVDFIEEETC